MKAVSLNSPKDHQFKYDVALSFAEEDRAFVDRVAAYLKREQVKLFYDDHERIQTWGRDLTEYLDEVYRTHARFCVIFVSKYYKEKHWTRHEAEWAKARAFFMKNKAYILPFRLDDTEIPALNDSIAYLSIHTHNEEELAQAIMDKIAESKKRRFPLWLTYLILAIGVLPGLGIAFYKNSTHTPVLSAYKEPVRAQGSWDVKAICKDGWLSQSQGSGTCSGHGGIDRVVDTTVYGESLDACRKASMQNYRTKKRQ